MMKNIMKAGLAMMAMVFATACQNDEIVEQSQYNDSNELTIQVTKDIDSRIAMTKDGPVWSAGDKLFVYGGKSQGWLTLVDGAGSGTATFSGLISGKVSDLKYVVFGDVERNGNNVTVTLEEVDAAKADAPMMGNFSAGNRSITLNHLCGLLALNIEGLNNTDVEISGTGIGGTVSLDAANQKLITNDTKTTIKVTKAGNKTFYVPFFVNGSNEAFTITVDGKSFTLVVDTEIGGLSKALDLKVSDTSFESEDGNTESAVIVNPENDNIGEIVSKENANIYLEAGEYTGFPTSQIAEGVTIICEEGTVFEGKTSADIKGATIVGATFSNESGSAIGGNVNGTFKDCNFTGTNGLRYCYAGETVVFEDCVFSGSVYGAHFDGGTNEIIFKNCTLSGFNALGSAVTLVTFEGCTFKGNGESSYNGANLWGNTKMINCEFTFDGSTKTEWLDCISKDKTYEFTNCTVNGIKYTEKNYTDFDEIFSRNNVTIKINGVDCPMKE